MADPIQFSKDAGRVLTQVPKNIASIPPYVPGKPIEDVKRDYGLTKVIKLASNENPAGLSQKVIDLLADRETLESIVRYPDANGFELKKALSEFLSVPSTSITLGNGSDDVLHLMAKVFLESGDEGIFSQFAFAIYPLVIQAADAIGVEIPAIDYGADLDAFLQAVTPKTKLIYLANPNNPTGTYVPKEEVEAFMAKLPADVIFVYDEAYYEFIEEDQRLDVNSMLAKYPNFVLTRTFSKIYGLAGLRLGYMVAHPQITEVVNRVRDAFNINGIALAAGPVALADQAFVQSSLEVNAQGKAFLYQLFDELGFDYIPSKTNFVVFKPNVDPKALFEALLKRGVIIRYLAGYSMPEFLRVSIGTADDLDFFAKQLKAALAELT